MAPKPRILVYQDYIHNNGALVKRLSQTYGENNVRFCDAEDILKGVLTSKITLFVIGGGADLYYCEKLNGERNAKIRAYVEAGGNYLGICAGAYYAADNIEWAANEEQPIKGERELKFSNSTASGPVYEFLEENDFNKSWTNIVDINIGGEIYPAVYRGGPVFDGEGFATYSNGKTCIVKNRIGKGTIILSSPHIEFTPDLLAKVTYRNQNSSIEWTHNNIEKFEKRYHQERDLWSRILKEFEK